MVTVRELVADDRGVSKVVGVVLMVAIVGMLAATTATMVMGFGDMLNDPAPQVAFEFTYHEDVEDPEQFDEAVAEYATEVLIIEHIGGDSVDPDDVEVTTVLYDDGGSEFILEDSWAESTTGSDGGPQITGTMYPYAAGEYSLREGHSTVVWHDPNSDSSYVLAKWEGPDHE